MFQHILVPTDLTERSIRTTHVAVEMADRFGATVTLLHVIETIPGATFDELDEFYRKLEADARVKMAEDVARLGHTDVKVTQQIIYGRRGREILKFAAEERVDLIVLASHRLDPSDAEAGTSTISFRVGLLSNCAVLLVK